MSPKKIVEEKYQVPIWIVTFSDMTTNLLTFFVLLLSMGHIRDSSLFDTGQGPIYLESVKQGFGIKENPDFGNIKIKHSIHNPDDSYEGRTIDAKQEEIRRLFMQAAHCTTPLPSQITSKKTGIFPTNIRFASGKTALDERAKGFLTEFCYNLREYPAGEKISLYVLGLSNDELTQQQQWMLSATRAQVVADFLKNMLTADLNLPVYSWGAGPGGDWVGQDSSISGRSQILIVIMQGRSN